MFAFETQMRKMMEESLEPVMKSAGDDRERVVATHLTICDIQERLYVLEQFAGVRPLKTNKEDLKKAVTIPSDP